VHDPVHATRGGIIIDPKIFETINQVKESMDVPVMGFKRHLIEEFDDGLIVDDYGFQIRGWEVAAGALVLAIIGGGYYLAGGKIPGVPERGNTTFPWPDDTPWWVNALVPITNL
jgi:hypothetical protein